MNSLPKPSALQLSHERLLCTFSRCHSLPRPPEWTSSLIALAQLAPGGDSLTDPDFIRPEVAPYWLVSAGPRVLIRQRRRSCYSQLLVFPVFYVANENPRLATESRTGPVEPVRPHVYTPFYSVEGTGVARRTDDPASGFASGVLASQNSVQLCAELGVTLWFPHKRNSTIPL